MDSNLAKKIDYEKSTFSLINDLNNNSSLLLGNKAVPSEKKRIQPLVNKTNSGSFRNSLTKNKSFKEDLKKNISIISNARNEGDAYEQNRKLFKKEKIIDNDSDDEPSDTETDVPFLILPDNKFKIIFDFTISFVLIISAVVTPYQIAFCDQYSDSWYDIMTDILLTIDMILTFFTAYFDENDNLIKSRKKIAVNYIKTFFFIDIISILPINNFTKKEFKYNKLIRLIRFPKTLIKLAKLFAMAKNSAQNNSNKLLRRIIDALKTDQQVAQLIGFVFAYLVITHLCACFWFFIAKMEEFGPRSWVVRLGFLDKSKIELYLYSFYWAMTTVTTVGYGDISAATVGEKIFNLFTMLLGVVLMSISVGILGSIISVMDQKKKEINEKLEILTNIKNEFQLSKELYDKLRKIIKFDLTRNQKDKMQFIQDLPSKLRIELNQVMKDSSIEKFYFFKDQPNDFFAYVVPLLKPVKFSQNEYLYKSQDMIDEMYFVSKGAVIFCLDKKYGEREIKVIKRYQNFGEIEMCLNERLSFNIKIKSKNCELFFLKKSDFLRLSLNYKEYIGNFLRKSLLIYLKFDEEKNKMIAELESSKKGKTTSVAGQGNSSGMLTMVEQNKEKEDSKIIDLLPAQGEGKEESSFLNQSHELNHSYNGKKRIKFNIPKGDPVSKDYRKSIRKSQSMVPKEVERLEQSYNNVNSTFNLDIDKQSRSPKRRKSMRRDKLDEGSETDISLKFQKKVEEMINYLEAHGKGELEYPKELLVQLKGATNMEEKSNILDRINDALAAAMSPSELNI